MRIIICFPLNQLLQCRSIHNDRLRLVVTAMAMIAITMVTTNNNNNSSNITIGKCIRMDFLKIDTLLRYNHAVMRTLTKKWQHILQYVIEFKVNRIMMTTTERQQILK